MSKFTITPWRTQADLIGVRQQLYGPDGSEADGRRWAVDRAMAWKLRGNLPHAVESTALLVDAILHHDISTNSIFSIRAVYSAAFSRFVTGFCDIGRHRERTLEPSSMLEIAKQIDMPLEFVALRHEATHEELPGIQRLVSATNQALDWLWKVYWSRLEEPEDAQAVQTALPALRSALSTILRDFRRARRDELRNKPQTLLEGNGEVSDTRDACAVLCTDSQPRIEALAAVLVEERYILPSSRALGSSIEGAYLIWDDLLQDISAHLHGFSSAFVRSLLQAMTTSASTDPQSDVNKEAFAMWVHHVLCSDKPFSHNHRDDHAAVVEAMRWCCLHPGHWTEHVGRELLETGDGSFQAEWKDLFEASLVSRGGEHVDVNVPGSDVEMQRGGIDDPARTSQVELVVDGATGSWARAVAPVSVPIGVVH